jgi:putative membrane protein
MSASTNEKKNRSWLDYLGITARGFCMGAADVIPGVSGGTIALLMGIYNELVDAINAVNAGFIRNLITLRWKAAFADFPWKFLVALVIGIGTAILTLSQLLRWALNHHPVIIWSFFFGLVFASVIVVMMRAGKISAKMGVTFLAAAAGAYVLVGLRPGQTPETAWFLFISGAVAICAMIMPGVSGAFILVLLGKYEYVLNAVVQRDILTIAILGAGAVVGLLSFARLLKWLLRRYYAITISVLAGFMLGSLRVLWPWKGPDANVKRGVPGNVIPVEFTPETAEALFLMVLALVLVVSLEYLSSKRLAGTQVAVQEKHTHG